MEKFFSVIIEMESGERKTLPVQGESHGKVFQQVKAMPGVRRVGKVSEMNANGTPANGASGNGASANGKSANGSPTLAHPNRSSHFAQNTQSTGREQKADSRGSTVHFTSTGPRIVMNVRPTGGEQPFKHLIAPPERPKPPEPVKVFIPQPVMKAVPVEQVEKAEEPDTTTPQTYRVIKSRRQTGQPILLQRGTWHESKGKRLFTVSWEKGFDDKEKAKKHQRWVEQTEKELAEVESHD